MNLSARLQDISPAAQKNLAAALEPMTPRTRLLGYSILGALMTGDYDLPLKFLNLDFRYGVTKQERLDLMNTFNQHLLFERELEFTSHGLKRSFRFWSEAEKAAYIDFANAVIAGLSGLSRNVCIGYGTALAFGRSRDFIPHDDDLDLIIGLDVERYPDFAACLSAVEKTLADNGFRVSGNYVTHRHVLPEKGGPSLDLFVGIIQDGFFSSYPGPRGVIRAADVFPAADFRIWNRTLALPRNLETYLETVYGATWRVPDPAFSHNWNKEPYADFLKL